MPVEREVLGDVRPGLLVVSAAVALLLLIACGNLASLLLARSQRRAPEMAMRAALGAGRARLMRQVLTESLVLAVAGGVVGVVLAWAGTRLVVILGPNLPRLDEVRVDARALWFALGVSVVTGVLFGLLPAWVQARRGLRQVAAGTGRGTTSAAGPWVRGPLIAAQIALSVTPSAITAALLWRSARELAGRAARLRSLRGPDPEADAGGGGLPGQRRHPDPLPQAERRDPDNPRGVGGGGGDGPAPGVADRRLGPDDRGDARAARRRAPTLRRTGSSRPGTAIWRRWACGC